MGNDNAKSVPFSNNDPATRNFDDVEEERLKHTFKVLCGGTKHSLNNNDFRNHLCSSHPSFGSKLFSTVGAESINEEQFITWGKGILGLVTMHQQIEFYISLFNTQGGELTLTDCEELCICCFDAALCVAGMAGTYESSAGSAELKAVLKSMFGSAQSICAGDITSWSSRHCKKLFDPLHHYTTSVLRGDQSYAASKSQGACAVEGSSFENKLSGCVLSPCVAWLLSCHLPSAYIPSIDQDLGGLVAFSSALAGVLHPSGWQLLYSSNHHGAGKTRFLHHIMDYKAASVMLLEFEEHVYVVAADKEWKEDIKRWGGDDCMLVQIQPAYRQMTAGAGLLWFNLEDRTMPKGISVGKDSRTTFVEIDEDLSSVKHYGVQCKLDAIEVWGCGGRKALEEQKKQQVWETQQAEKAKGRKLKLEDWRDNPDKQLLDMGGVTTEHNERT